jgi:hypothetical protein
MFGRLQVIDVEGICGMLLDVPRAPRTLHDRTALKAKMPSEGGALACISRAALLLPIGRPLHVYPPTRDHYRAVQSGAHAIRSSGATESLLHFGQEVEVSFGGRESLSHRVDRDVSASPLTAPLDASGDCVRGLVEASDHRLLAELRRLAARLAQVFLYLRPPFRAPLRGAGKDEAIAESRSSPKDRLGEASEPDRDAASGAGIDTGTIDVIELALERHQGLAPELAQELHLFLLAPATSVEALPERLVLDVVPTDADTEADASAGEQVDVGHLPRNEGGLALRQDQDPRHELDALGECGEVSEHHERVVEGVLLRVRSRELGLAALVCRTEDMVIREEIVEAERLHVGPDAANRLRVAAKLDLWIDSSDFHKRSLPAAGMPGEVGYSTPNTPGVLAIDGRFPKFSSPRRDRERCRRRCESPPNSTISTHRHRPAVSVAAALRQKAVAQNTC